jgi:polar amino acid transport system substrate-binding protein
LYLKKIILLICVLSFGIAGCKIGNHKRTSPYVIGKNPGSFVSLSLYGAEKNVSGFSDDLVYEIAKDQDIQVRLFISDASPITSLLDEENIDGVLSAQAPTEQRMRDYIFSEPYFILGPVLVVRQDATYNSLQEMGSREVGYDRGSTTALQLTDTGEVIFTPYDDMLRAFEDLENGRVDGVVCDAIVAYRLASNLYRGKVRISGPPLVPIALRLVVKKGKSEELIPLFNKGLEDLKKTHMYQKILRYWALYDVMEPGSVLTESPGTF